MDEVIGHFQTLERDADCPDRLDVLLDLSEMTTVPVPEQLRRVSEEIARVRDRIQFGACAIVARRAVIFGMSRMFEVFAQDFFQSTHVFQSVDEAKEWLEAERAAPPRR